MTTNPGPLYLECTRGQSLATWAGAVLNAAIVAWCASWLLIHAQARPTGLVLLVVVLVGVFLGDLFTGFVHWMTDTWFDEVMLTRVVSIAREHHLYPYNIVGYSFRDYVGYTSWPAVMMFGPILPFLLLFGSEPSSIRYGFVLVFSEVCLLSFFGTHFHRFGHQRSDSRFVQFLQKAHILITPQYHALHHGGTHTTHYCVVTGWANVVCDAIGFWRGLEKLVVWLTGAVPRHNDDEWFARFREDRSFLTDPVPSLQQWRQHGTARPSTE